MPNPIKYDHGYRINFNHKGKKYRKRFPNTSLETVQKYIDSIINEKPEKVTKLKSDIDEYIRWSEKVKQKKWTWIRDLRQMLYYFADNTKAKTARQIKFDTIRDFQSFWFADKKHCSPNTWEMYRQGLSSFLNWINKRDPSIINYASDPEFKIKVHQNTPDTFEPDELEKIFNYFEKENYDMYVAFKILSLTGMRLGELMTLKVKDCDLKSKIKTIRCGTKSKETRTIPIPDKLIPLMDRKGVYILDTGTGKPLHNKKTYNRWLDKALFICDIPKGRHVVHSFRHTYARRLIEAGVDLPMVQKLMGHSDIRTTMRYAQHFSLDRAFEAVNKL